MLFFKIIQCNNDVFDRTVLFDLNNKKLIFSHVFDTKFKCIKVTDTIIKV